MVIVPVEEPVPIFVAAAPEVLTFVVPTSVVVPVMPVVPTRLIASRAEPMFMVSAFELSVPMLTVSPAVPVAILTVLALLPVPRFTAPVVPESRVMAEVVVDLIVPSAAKVKALAEVAIVSIEATPVKAPVVDTLSPPLEAIASVPVVLPRVTLLVPVPRATAPEPFKVNVPDPCE